MANLASLSTIINILLVVSGIVALAWVFNRQRSRDLSDLQGRIIDTQKQSMETQDARIDELEHSLERYTQTLSTIQAVFRKRGVFIRIDGDFVTVESRKENDLQQQTVTRIGGKVPIAVSHEEGNGETS